MNKICRSFERIAHELSTESRHNERQPPYRQLHRGKIRLLELKAGQNGSRIECNLLHVRLKRAPTYEALSYTWGPPTKVAIPDEKAFYISCNEHDFSVTSNLHAALCRLRDNEKNRMLWIDAICINQNDIREKTRQIVRMGSIYQSARQVLVWLGEEIGTDSLAFETIKRLYDFLDHQQDQVVCMDSLTFLQEVSTASETVSSPLEAMSQLFRRRWFQRLWVVQEVVMAKTCLILCGGMILPWDVLETVMVDLRIRELWDSIAYHDVHSNALQMFDSVVELKLDVQQPIDPPYLLNIARSFSVTKIQDRLFALVGLFDQIGYGSSWKLPEYDTPWNEILFSFGRRCLDNYSLQMFSYVNTDHQGGQGNLPSWIPRWDQQGQRVPFATMASQFGFLREQIATFRFRGNGHLLFVRGAIIDKVYEVSKQVHREESPERFALQAGGGFKPVVRLEKSIYTLLNEGEAFVKAAAPHLPSNQSPSEYFWRTVTCDSILNGERAPVDMAESYRALRDDLNASFRKKYDIKSSKGNVELSNTSRPFLLALRWTRGRSMCRTKDGYVGLVPRTTRNGDLVCAFPGALSPIIIRPKSTDTHELIGEAYIHGITSEEIPANSEIWEHMQRLTLV